MSFGNYVQLWIPLIRSFPSHVLSVVPPVLHRFRPSTEPRPGEVTDYCLRESGPGTRLSRVAHYRRSFTLDTLSCPRRTWRLQLYSEEERCPLMNPRKSVVTLRGVVCVEKGFYGRTVILQPTPRREDMKSFVLKGTKV